ncbi:MAG: endolytic transglycosylase MltG [Beutenbergiaceae bacterium]
MPTRPWRRNLAVVGVLVLLLGLVLGGAWQLVIPMFDSADRGTVTDYPGPGTTGVDVVIDDAQPPSIAQVLTDAGVVATEDAFLSAYANNPAAAGIVAGSYALLQQMSAAGAVEALLDPANRTDRTLTIPVGWTAHQVFEKISEVMGISLDQVLTAASEVTLPNVADGSIEGWLFADTYVIAQDDSALEVLTEMVRRTSADMGSRDVPALDQQRVLIEASIVQAEVDPTLYGQVARVIANRFAGCTSTGAPLLQMNSTLSYGLSKPTIDLTLADLEDESTPYNTYIFEGLPPTPINSPSAAAIDAVLAPPEGDWCYFVTVNLETGETRFTDSPVEHEDNRRQYRDWLAQWREDQSLEAADG